MLPASPLQPVVNLQADGQTADQLKIPLVLLFSRTECPYCETMRNLYLEPMQDDPRFRDQMLAREINIDSGNKIIGFDGNPIPVSQFAKQWEVSLTPTLVFLNGRGEPTAEEIVGLGNADFFSYYLEKAVEDSVNKLRDTDRIKLAQ